MAHKLKIKASLAAALALGVTAHASGTEMTLSGIVVAAACTVDTQTKDQTVTFEQARAVNYRQAGNTSEWQDFELTLSACPASTTQVTATFSGNADSDDITKFANSQGDASGMALQMMTRDHLTEITPLASPAVAVDSVSRRAVFPLSARMYTPTGAVSPGEFNTVVQFDFTYQ